MEKRIHAQLSYDPQHLRHLRMYLNKINNHLYSLLLLIQQTQLFFFFPQLLMFLVRPLCPSVSLISNVCYIHFRSSNSYCMVHMYKIIPCSQLQLVRASAPPLIEILER
eukprot:NODE_1039_length_1847_cov_0.397597.p2 type:complete len:109 gc:universal NODE_1039_length_1847_cov_0.397597:762-436(-)